MLQQPDGALVRQRLVVRTLGRHGVVFLDATAHAPLTLPSHASILTGRYPTSHGIRDNSGYALAESVPTLATLLHGAGYHTAAFVSSFVLRRSTGLARGFDVYDDRFEGIGRAHLTTTTLERKAAETAREAASWMKTAPHPFFSCAMNGTSSQRRGCSTAPAAPIKSNGMMRLVHAGMAA